MAKTTSDITYVTNRRPRAVDPIVPDSVFYDTQNRVIKISYFVGFGDEQEVVEFSYTKEGYLVFRGIEYRGYAFNMWEATIVPEEPQESIKDILTEWKVNHDELLCEFQKTREMVLKANLLPNDIKIKSADGEAKFAAVSEFQALKVNNQALPDIEDPLAQIPITGFLINPTGGPDGEFDARVDGDPIPVDFSITARDDSDIFLQALGFLIAGGGATLSNFGGLSGNGNNPPLANGCQLIYFNNDVGEIILADNLKSNFDFVRLCQGLPAFTSGNGNVFIADNIAKNLEGVIPVLKLENFGLPYGIRIRKNSEDKLSLRIRDDLAADAGTNQGDIAAFNVFYYGNRLLSEDD